MSCLQCFEPECICEPERLDLCAIAAANGEVVLFDQGGFDIVPDPSPRHPVVHGLICSDACADAVLAILTAMNAGKCTFPELAEQVLAARAKAGGR